jgi:hypothetical protein
VKPGGPGEDENSLFSDRRGSRSFTSDLSHSFNVNSFNVKRSSGASLDVSLCESPRLTIAAEADMDPEAPQAPESPPVVWAPRR